MSSIIYARSKSFGLLRQLIIFPGMSLAEGWTRPQCFALPSWIKRRAERLGERATPYLVILSGANEVSGIEGPSL